MGFCSLILIWIWSLVFGTPILQDVALYLYFKGVKNSHVLQVLIWCFRGQWRFLSRVRYLDLDMDIVRNLAWNFPEVLSHSDQ